MSQLEAPPEEDWTVTQDRDESAPRLGGGSWLIAVARRFWRWLTSMRTALILLFLLALAAIPGSLLPQEKVSPAAVSQYYQAHPKLAPLVNDIGGFAVFASPWFSAIYLLLFISLIGCLVPRLRVYYQALRRVPPDAPARLSRMPVTASAQLTVSPTEAAAVAKTVLRSRRYRTVIRTHDESVTVSAEKGYLKEAGNLLFHFSLMALLVGVAFGSWYGWHADRLLVEGTSFCSTTPEFSDYSLGERVGPGDLAPFCVTLNSFNATYTDAGEPSHFAANTSYVQGTSTSSKSDTIQVNAPLRLHDANVYLIGHGYAPILKFTDKYGKSETLISPFLPADGFETSTGVATFPDLNIAPDSRLPYAVDPHTFAKQQIGFEGTFLPTVSGDLPTSVYPGLRDPEILLTPYIGDLGLDNGSAQSVYTLNQAEIDSGALKAFSLTDGRPISLKPGQSKTLSDGSTIEFVGTRQWAALAIRYDPGEKIVLVGALLLVLGLVGSLTGRRRRVWFRFSATGSSISGEAGGLARAEYASFPDEFDAIVTAVMRSPAGPVASEGRNAHGKSVP